MALTRCNVVDFILMLIRVALVPIPPIALRQRKCTVVDMFLWFLSSTYRHCEDSLGMHRYAWGDSEIEILAMFVWARGET